MALAELTEEYSLHLRAYGVYNISDFKVEFGSIGAEIQL